MFHKLLPILTFSQPDTAPFAAPAQIQYLCRTGSDTTHPSFSKTTVQQTAQTMNPYKSNTANRCHSNGHSSPINWVGKNFIQKHVLFKKYVFLTLKVTCDFYLTGCT